MLVILAYGCSSVGTRVCVWLTELTEYGVATETVEAISIRALDGRHPDMSQPGFSCWSLFCCLLTCFSVKEADFTAAAAANVL